MKQTLAQIQEETLKRFLADFEYRGFSELGWWTKDEECRPMQIHHIEAFLTQSNLRVLEKVKEILKKHRGIYGMGNIDDVYLELSTLIEQK